MSLLESPKLFSRRWFSLHPALTFCGAVLAAGAILACFAGTILFFVFSLLRNAEVTQLAIKQARESHTVSMRLGRPIQVGWLITGEIEITAASGHANLEIPIHGPKAKAVITAIADKKGGHWVFTILDAEFNDPDQRIDLLDVAAR